MNYKIYFVRHGEAGHNRDQLVMGTIDSELTKEGLKQAESLRDKLKNVHFDKVYASPLQRAINTARIVTGHSDVGTDPKLIERTFGEIEGKPIDELNKLRVKADAQGKDPWTYKLSPDTESDFDIYNRVIEFIDKKSSEWQDKNILIASHSGPVRAILIGLGFFTETSLPPGTFKNGSCAVIENVDEVFNLIDTINA